PYATMTECRKENCSTLLDLAQTDKRILDHINCMRMEGRACPQPVFQCMRWRDRTMAQNVAKPRRIRPRMALTRRKKIGPMRCGMKRTTTVSVVNQVIRPA